MKIITVLGTRPEIIRLSRVIPSLDEAFDHVLVHTGQNSDVNLSDVFFRDLRLRKPDHFLRVSQSSPGRIIGDILIGVEQVFLKEKPDAVLILGDTNSALSAIIARRMKIPVFHMEAGNRCFDPNVPEESNRRIVDGHQFHNASGFLDGVDVISDAADQVTIGARDQIITSLDAKLE